MDVAQDNERRQQLQTADEKLLGAVVGEFGDVEEVAGHACHQLPNLGLVEVGERLFLQAVEQIGTHVGFNLHAHNVPCVRLVEGGNHVD